MRNERIELDVLVEGGKKALMMGWRRVKTTVKTAWWREQKRGNLSAGWREVKVWIMTARW